MKKQIVVAAALALTCVLSACGGGKATIDIDALTTDVVTNAAFADEMSKLDTDTVAALYGIDYAVSESVYVSSGATAEEVAVFELKDSDDAQSALTAAQARIESQEASFKDYTPEELPKLKDAIVEAYGNYVIVCVCDDDAAKDIIDGYTK